MTENELKLITALEHLLEAPDLNLEPLDEETSAAIAHAKAVLEEIDVLNVEETAKLLKIFGR